MKDFSPDQKAWLSKHKAIKEAVNECLEDAENVNSLEDGMPDMEPYKQTLKAVHLTIEVSKNNLIRGPYDSHHWELITRYLNINNPTPERERKFWSLFSLNCAMFKDEDESYSNEAIYLKSMIDLKDTIILIEHSEIVNEVADLNTNTIRGVKGEGVYARLT